MVAASGWITAGVGRRPNRPADALAARLFLPLAGLRRQLGGQEPFAGLYIVPDRSPFGLCPAADAAGLCEHMRSLSM